MKPKERERGECGWGCAIFFLRFSSSLSSTAHQRSSHQRSSSHLARAEEYVALLVLVEPPEGRREGVVLTAAAW